MIIFLVEEYSMRKFLENILPRLNFKNNFEIKHHRGKEDLITCLDQIVPSLSKRAQHIVLIVDQDKEDCKKLKDKLQEKMKRCACDYKIRIACYELEAWFLGDMEAIAKCSSRFKAKTFQNKEKYRHVDGLNKPSTEIETIVPDWREKYSSKAHFAEKIAQFISLETQNIEVRNRSHSFRIFLETLHTLRGNTT